VDIESYNIEQCDVGIVSYGCTSRAVYETVDLAKEKGINVGFVRLRTIWPFPDDVIKTMAQNVKAIFVPEMNLRQLYYEVERAAHGYAPVISINKIGGGKMITPEELLSEIFRRVGNVG
jgi:2-oxoglutarate ferredoxin oxidoreductase subunit alpha